MTPDLDKYLERLVKEADSSIMVMDDDTFDPTIQRVALGAFPSLITAICAVLREKREASHINPDFQTSCLNACKDVPCGHVSGCPND